MSIKSNKVILEKSAKQGTALLILLAVLEGVFSFFLYLSLAGRIFESRPAESAAGVPQMLSYQGRLTDTSGNPLGGSGAVYCFRYSIYDAQSGGSKLWPAGTPTNSTTTVADGVFNDQIGRMDTLTYDFFSTSTVYLNVDVNTATSTCGGSWESLSPRQQILASGFALTSESVYGDALRTPTSTKVQIGTGAGVSSNQTLLSLDVKNVADTIGSSCTDNGALWYNSNNTRALLCENGLITQVSNPTSTISGIGVNGSTITAGTAVFSNSNNVSFGLAGSTITATATFAGGGGGFAIYDFVNLNRVSITNVTNMTATGVTQRPIFIPFILPGSLTWNRGAIEVSRATSGSNLFTADFGVYSFVNSTQISLMGSLQNTYSGTNTGSQSGVRRLLFTGIPSGISALTPGHYVMGMKFSASAGTASMNYSLRGVQSAVPPVGQIFPGANSYMTATSQLSSQFMMRFLGRYTTTSANLPNSAAFTQIQGYTSMYPLYFHLQST